MLMWEKLDKKNDRGSNKSSSKNSANSPKNELSTYPTLCSVSKQRGITMGSMLALSVPGPKSAGVCGTPAHAFVTCMIKEFLDICVLTNKNVQVEVIYRQKMLDC